MMNNNIDVERLNAIMNGQLQPNNPIDFGGNTEASAVVRGRMEGVPTGGAAPMNNSRFTKFEKTPQQLIEEKLQAANKKINKAVNTAKKETKDALDTLYKNGADMKSRLEKEYGKQVAKKATTNTSKGVAGKVLGAAPKAAGVVGKVGGGVLMGLPVVDSLYNTVKNWNAEGSTPTTRFMDILGNAGAYGGVMTGAMTGHPIVGTTGGIIASSNAHNNAQILRDANRPYESYLAEAQANALAQAEAMRGSQNGAAQTPTNMSEVTGNVGFDNAGERPTNLPNVPNVADGDPNPPITDLENFIVQNSDPNANYTGQAVSNDLTPINDVGTNTNQQAAQPTYQVDPMLLDRINYYSNMSPSTGGIQTGQPTGQAAPVPPAIRDKNGQSLTAIPPQQPVQAADPATQMALDIARNQGYVTQQDIYNNLQRYNQMQAQAIANNPYYGGDIIRAEQPYQVDRDKLARLQQQDEWYAYINATTGRALPTDSAQRYLNNTQQMYQAQMANQAGVPYSDYTTGLTERNKQMIEAAAKQRENELTFQLNQTNDMAKKLALYQEILKNRIAMEQAIRTENIKGSYDLMKAGVTGGYGLAQEETKGQYDLAKARLDNRTKIQERLLQNQGALEVAKNNNLTEIQKQQLILSDPNKTIKGASDFMIALGYLNPTQQEAWIRSLSPAVQVRVFGRQLTPQEMTAIFRFAQQSGGGANGIIAALERLRGIPSSYGNNGQ